MPLAVNSIHFLAKRKPKIALYFDDENVMEKLYLYVIEKQGFLKDLLS